MAKREKTTRFSIQGFDLKHYRTTEQYVAAVQALFDRATLAIAQSASGSKIDPDKPFSFDDYPQVKAELQKVVGQLASQLKTTIESGSKKQWLFACDKNDGFLASIMDTSKLSKARLKKMQDRNLDALSAFQTRKVDGMNLSQRVWRYVGQYRDQIETALDVGLGDGRSAQQLARDVKMNLQEPNRLFRRVRDKRGNLVLSKAARAFHPGQGVYRSSVKNAQRLTRSEINMAYRESDFLRWQQLDFVVGFEIHRSNHRPLCKCKMCDRLQGRYPKTFKFKGWHPQCMCFATPILMDEETFDENELGDLKAALNGTEYKQKQAKNVVLDVPDGFKEWVAENMEASANWSSTPYFIKDNFVDGDLAKGLKIALPTVATDAPGVSYVPIKTVEEAKALATTLGIKKVDFGDATIDEINIALEVLHEASNQMDFELDYFFLAQDIHKQSKSFTKPVGGYYSADRKEMAIDLTTFRKSHFTPLISYKDKIVSLRNNITSLERQIEQSEARLGRSKAMDKMMKADIKMLRSRIADIEIKIRSFEKLIASGNDALPFTVAASFEDVKKQVQAEIWHEIGHYVDHKTGRQRFKEGNFISEYCKDMRGEEFAEWFSYYKMHGEKGVPADLLKIFKSVERTVPAKEAPKPDPVQVKLDALMPQIEAARKVADEWGLTIQRNTLDKAVANREIDKINERIATITQKANELLSMLSTFVKGVADVTKSAKGYGIDLSKLPEFAVVSENLMAAQADKKNWKNNFGAYQNNLEALKRAIQNELLRRQQEEEKKKSANATEVSMADWRKRTEEAGTIDKSENDKEFEKVVGTEKGVDMTFEEANDLRGNPNYAEEWLECDQKEATHRMKKADGTQVFVRKNPSYKKKFTINCQSCVVAHEMRRRGFDVEAIGKTKNSIPDILSRHTELAWLDKDGNTPTSTKVGWAYTPGDADATAASMIANLETATKAVGRYHIKWTWNTMRSGHIITCERLKDGKLRIYDPQCGEIITDFATYGKRFLHGSLKILRVDTLRINPLYAGCLKKTPKPKKKK